MVISLGVVEVEEYISLPIVERQNHLQLEDECIEIGGDSQNFTGLLAYYLNTTIPLKGTKVHLCHACHNGGCSNLKHLYWGTNQENFHDAMNCGKNLGVHESTKRKYGEKRAKEIYAINGNSSINSDDFVNAHENMIRKYGEERTQEIYNQNCRNNATKFIGSNWITNNSVEFRLKVGEVMPTGFQKGR